MHQRLSKIDRLYRDVAIFPKSAGISVAERLVRV
jgi:hypothetical protein